MSENGSGLKAVGKFKCLVLTDPVEAVTAGGIVLAQETVDKTKYNTDKGILVLKGGNACYDWQGWVPEVGQRISFYSQASRFYKGKDGRDYRIVNDDDIIGWLDE